MKKISFLFLLLLVTLTANSQNSGLGFNYQAVVRNADGMLLANTYVNLLVSLYPGQTAATPTWIETHHARTDASGCFGITVGKGTRDYKSVAAEYKDINFASVYYWMKIEILEGETYREVSFAQLPSSPYSEVAHNSSIIAGMIAPFAGPADKIPAGWLLCDGTAVSRSEYGNLYKAIGVCWGEGDGSTTFNLPDLRGMFLRGVLGEKPELDSSGKPVKDPDVESRVSLFPGGNMGNNVGSYQEDAIRNITGYFNGPEFKFQCGGAFFDTGGRGVGTNDDDNDNVIFGFDASRVVPVGGDNRPKNAYVTYIIKY